MDVLILMRHAKAVRDHEADSDRDRGLTEDGRLAATAQGARLARSGLVVDRVLASSAVRTRETAELVAAAWPEAPPPDFIDALYMAEGGAIWDIARTSGGRAVLVIGHNPGLHDLVGALVRQANDRSALATRIASGLPTAAFAAFAVTGDRADAAGPRLIDAFAP